MARVRSALETVVFPLAPRLQLRGAHIAGYLAFFVAGVAYLTVIPAGRSHLFRVWAEDGTDWLTDAALLPPLSQLFDPLGGYFHVIPRLIAQITVGVLPIEAWAAGLAVFAACVRVACALAVYGWSRGHVPSRVARLVIASAVVWLPTGNWDALNNAANLHWFVFFALLWAILARPRGTTATIALTIFVVLASVSVPLAVVLVPLAAARLFLPGWKNLLPAIALFPGVVATVITALSMERPRQDVEWAALGLSAAARGPLAMMIGPQALYDLVVSNVGRTAPILIAAAVAGTIVGALVIGGLVVGLARERFVIATLVALAVFCGVFTLSSNWRDFLSVTVDFRTPRYSTLPALLLFAAVVIAIGALARRTRILAAVGAIVVGVTVLGGTVWQLAYPSDLPGSPVVHGITWTKGLDDVRPLCERPDRDAIKVTILPHDGWKAMVPCDLLLPERGR